MTRVRGLRCALSFTHKFRAKCLALPLQPRRGDPSVAGGEEHRNPRTVGDKVSRPGGSLEGSLYLRNSTSYFTPNFSSNNQTLGGPPGRKTLPGKTPGVTLALDPRLRSAYPSEVITTGFSLTEISCAWQQKLGIGTYA